MYAETGKATVPILNNPANKQTTSIRISSSNPNMWPNETGLQILWKTRIKAKADLTSRTHTPSKSRKLKNNNNKARSSWSIWRQNWTWISTRWEETTKDQVTNNPGRSQSGQIESAMKHHHLERKEKDRGKAPGRSVSDWQGLQDQPSNIPFISSRLWCLLCWVLALTRCKSWRENTGRPKRQSKGD